MKMKFAKRLLAAAMCASMMVTPMTALATGGSGAASSAPASQVQTQGKVTVGGAGITSTVTGGYVVNNVAGFAITAPVADISSSYGLTGSDRPYVMAYDITEKTAPKAWASINYAAQSVGARVIGALNVDFGKRSGGKFERLPAGAGIRACVGIPGAVNPNLTYAVVRVLPGGSFTILPDIDSNPNTVTFDVVGGIGAYALIAY